MLSLLVRFQDHGPCVGICLQVSSWQWQSETVVWYMGQSISQQRNEFRPTFLPSLTRVLVRGGCMPCKYKSMTNDARSLARVFVMVQKGKMPEEAVLGVIQL